MWERDLGCPSNRGMDRCSEVREEPRVTGIAKRRGAWIRPQGKVEPDHSCQARERQDRYPGRRCPLDSTHFHSGDPGSAAGRAAAEAPVDACNSELPPHALERRAAQAGAAIDRPLSGGQATRPTQGDPQRRSAASRARWPSAALRRSGRRPGRGNWGLDRRSPRTPKLQARHRRQPGTRSAGPASAR